MKIHNAQIAQRRGHLGLAAGFLGTVLSLPFVSFGKTTAEDPNINTKPPIDLPALDMQDKRELEIKWTEAVDPIVQKRLANLYKAEEEDIKKLNKKEITEDQRQVKIAYVDFVGPSETGDDRGSELNLHVVKYYDEKQEDGTTLRTYVNEHWPINEVTGGVLLPEVIRVRVQVVSGPLNKWEAEDFFVTDIVQIIWNEYKQPLFARQHLYKELKDKNQPNHINKIQTRLLDNPISCTQCHHANSPLTESIFLPRGKKKTNFGAITPDEEFQKPYNEQRGYIKYIKYLQGRVENKELSQKFVDDVAKDLLDSTNMKNPNTQEALGGPIPFPWLDSDKETYKNSEPQFVGFTYEGAGKWWKKAIAEYYVQSFQLPGLGRDGGGWWDRADHEVVPSKYRK